MLCRSGAASDRRARTLEKRVCFSESGRKRQSRGRPAPKALGRRVGAGGVRGEGTVLLLALGTSRSSSSDRTLFRAAGRAGRCPGAETGPPRRRQRPGSKECAGCGYHEGNRSGGEALGGGVGIPSSPAPRSPEGRRKNSDHGRRTPAPSPTCSSSAPNLHTRNALHCPGVSRAVRVSRCEPTRRINTDFGCIPVSVGAKSNLVHQLRHRQHFTRGPDEATTGRNENALTLPSRVPP